MCVYLFLYVYIWRARRHFTFQIGNRHEADKSERRQGRVSIKASAHETALLSYLFLLLHQEARAAFYTHTHNFIYDAEHGGGERKQKKYTDVYSSKRFSLLGAHLSGLFAKRFMISNSDMAAEQYKFYDYAREAANQAEAAAAAPVLMMRAAFGLSPGLDFAVKCHEFEKHAATANGNYSAWCCASAGVTLLTPSSIRKIHTRGLFNFKRGLDVFLTFAISFFI